MTNYEKYKNKLINSNYTSKNGEDVFCDNFVEPKILKPLGKECSDITCSYCRVLTMIWLMDEYKEPEEPEIDWSKVPVDTNIYVRESIDDEWLRRYFAKYVDGKIYAWSAGYTSWSAGGEDNVMPWRYAKLAEEENL